MSEWVWEWARCRYRLQFSSKKWRQLPAAVFAGGAPAHKTPCLVSVLAACTLHVQLHTTHYSYTVLYTVLYCTVLYCTTTLHELTFHFAYTVLYCTIHYTKPVHLLYPRFTRVLYDSLQAGAIQSREWIRILVSGEIEPKEFQTAQGQVRSGNVIRITSQQVISGHIRSYQVISGHIKSSHIKSYHIKSYHIISYHIISYQVMSRYISTYQVTSIQL